MSANSTAKCCEASILITVAIFQVISFKITRDTRVSQTSNRRLLAASFELQ